MSDYEHILKKIAELTMKMSRAGFTDDLLEKFIEQMPDGRFSNINEGLLRKLYLAYINLGNFTLKPGVVNFGKSWGRDMSAVWHGYIVHSEDLHLYKSEFNLNKLGLIPFRKKKGMRLETELSFVRESKPDIELGTVWHLQWLAMHQEFIPKQWEYILRKKKGLIIFPGVRLGGDRVETKDRVTYPYFHVGTNSHSIEYSFDLLPEHLPYGGRSYFAYVGKKGKVPTLVTNKDHKTRLVLKTPK